MAKKSKNILVDFFSIIKYCLLLAFKASKFYTIIRIVTRIFNAVSGIVTMYLISELINALASLSGKPQVKRYVIILSILTLLVSLISAILNKVSEYCQGLHNEILMNYLNKYTMEKSLLVDIEYYDSPVFYDAIEAVRRDTYSISSIVWNIIDGISAIVTLCGAFIIISQKNVIYAVLILATIIPSTIVNQKFTKYLYNWDLTHIKEQRKLGYLRNIASNKEYAMEIRLFNIGNYLVEKFTSIWNLYYKTRKTTIVNRAKYVVFLSLLPEICSGVILLHMAMCIIDGYGTVGDYTLYSGMLGKLSSSIFSLVAISIRIYEDRLRIENIRNFENFQSKILSIGNKKITGNIKIEFKNVNFSYPNTNLPALKNVCFTVNSNDNVCIVGLNGAGKSTIMKLLLRFYDVDEGEILINDVNIKQYDILNLRKSFSVFFQKNINYSFTIKENVSLSDINNAKKHDGEVLRALEQSDALELLKNFPKGLDQYITKVFDEEGAELSGGQYQKLALARTFYRNSPVLLLDEPSASLDPEAEYKLFNHLEQYCQNKTTIFTSHRLSNIHLANYIILIENGQVVDMGTHEELMQQSEKYARLYRYQADKYR